MDEEKFNEFLEQFSNIKIEEYWVAEDVRPERSGEMVESYFAKN